MSTEIQINSSNQNPETTHTWKKHPLLLENCYFPSCNNKFPHQAINHETKSKLEIQATYPVMYFDFITFVSLNVTGFWLVL